MAVGGIGNLYTCDIVHRRLIIVTAYLRRVPSTGHSTVRIGHECPGSVVELITTVTVPRGEGSCPFSAGLSTSLNTDFRRHGRGLEIVSSFPQEAIRNSGRVVITA